VALVYCGQTVGRIKMKLGMQEGLGPGHIVLDGDPAPPPPKGQSPKFSAHVYCGQTARWIKMPLGMKVGSSAGNCVLYGDPAPSPHKGVEPPPQFSAHFYCGQAAAWIKMPLGTEVGIGLRDIVFDVDPATPRKRAHPPHPIFGTCLLWPNGWMDEDAAWSGNRPRHRPHCIRRDRSSRERGTAPPPSFRPISIVATVAHLSYC